MTEYRSACLRLFAVTAVCCCVALLECTDVASQDAASPRTIGVASVAELQAALDAAQPGDTIEVADGEYRTDGALMVTKTGAEEAPITIRAKSRGKATITGAAGFELVSVSHVTVEGFSFATDNTAYAVLTRSCNNVRITRNQFKLNEVSEKSRHWVNITGEGSNHNRVDHNLFEEKHELGCYIVTGGSSEPDYQSTTYDRIDHNHFRNIGPRVQNGMESIRLGVSTLSTSSGFITVEHNLFEDCDGDPEVISIKSCDDVVRYNTFVDCQGAVVSRAGHRNTITGNFFFCRGDKQGVGGVRVHGDDHRVINNYFEALTDEGFTTTNGDMVTERTEDGTYFQTRNALIAFNTWVNCDARILDIGNDKGGECTLPPTDCSIANNIISGAQGELVLFRGKDARFRWAGNIVYPDDAIEESDIRPSRWQIHVIDPKLVQSDGLWRLSADSPAIDAAPGRHPEVAEDIDGQTREDKWDIGADEYSREAIKRRPLTPDDVGPDAAE